MQFKGGDAILRFQFLRFIRGCGSDYIGLGQMLLLENLNYRHKHLLSILAAKSNFMPKSIQILCAQILGQFI